MELGNKLQQARIQNSLTQEETAQQIGVSRQTLSSWENGRTYPDIVSLICLCDLYQLSLDAVLKDDGGMSGYVGYLDRAIAALKKRQKIYKCVEIGVYAALMVFYVVGFFLTGSDPYGGQYEFQIMVHGWVIPCVIAILSLLIGVDRAWGRERWLLIPFFALTYLLASSISLMLPGSIYEVLTEAPALEIPGNLYALSMLLPMGLMDAVRAGALCAAGLGIGLLFRKVVHK